MSYAFFSLREKYPSEAMGDEGLMRLQVGFKQALTCLADARLSSPEGRGMPWHTCLAGARDLTGLANVSVSDAPRLSSPEAKGEECMCPATVTPAIGEGSSSVARCVCGGPG